LFLGALSPLRSQIYPSGQLDIVMRNYSAKDYTNKTFAFQSNYDAIRFRLFLDAKPADNVAVFTQFLVVNSKFNLFAAYARYSFPESNIHLQIGLIPNTVGIWGPRTYSDKNPFIAVPLLYVYKSSLNIHQLSNNPEDLIGAREKSEALNGLPILYDNCWNTGIEVFGSLGKFDWSLAAITGSVTKPTVQPEKELPQLTGKLRYYPLSELQFTISAFWGTYLLESVQEQLNDSSININDYTNSGAGLSLFYTSGYFEIQSEAFWARWEHPFLGDLEAFSSYGELEYKFAIQWYAAFRAELIRYSQINNNSETSSWDVPLNRYDFVLGYKLNRNTRIKLNGQFTRSPAGKIYDDDIYAIQFALNL